MNASDWKWQVRHSDNANADRWMDGGRLMDGWIDGWLDGLVVDGWMDDRSKFEGRLGPVAESMGDGLMSGLEEG